MGDDGCVVRLRGLPWSATPDDVVNFFGDEVGVVLNGVHFTFSREGRPSGEAFVELQSEVDVEAALTRHKEHMGSRYIEVFRSKQSEMDWVVKRSGRQQPQSGEAVLRLRGLPFGCSKEEIAQFFSGLELVPNGIMLPEDRQGQGTGEAYVQFASPEIAEKALLKHKERIGHRYIEIFKSTLNEATKVMSMEYGMGKPRPLMATRPGPYNRNDCGFVGRMSGSLFMGGSGYGRGRGGRNLKGFYDDDDDDDFGGGSMGRLGMGGIVSRIDLGMSRRGNMRHQCMGRNGGGMRGGQPGSQYFSKTGHSVHMRGLPFQANEQDVADFFSPLVPVNVEFEFNGTGRPTGEANVEFSTHQEAVEAMKKHKANMEHRYIELFLNSTPRTRTDGGGSGGGFSGAMDFDGDDGVDVMPLKGSMRKGIMMGNSGGYGASNLDGGQFGNMRARMNNNPNYTEF